MSKGRLEAFSDGVIAIIITIMVLELHVPHEGGFAALRPLLPTFACYALSFVYVGIYWNNHHHMFQAVEKIDGRILWANLHLLFWLSLMPFLTGWMGENHFDRLPTALYGIGLLMSAIAFTILEKKLMHLHGDDSAFNAALGDHQKEKISLACYILGALIAFWMPLVAMGLYVLVAGIWFIPDRRFERIAGE